jgi:hypothetical protein
MKPALEPGKRATYQDVLDAPERMVAEIVGGELYLTPRPANAATVTGSRLIQKLAGFDAGDGGPGGWLILVEPELHFGTPEDVDPARPPDQCRPTIVVPDLAGWRRERLPVIPDLAYLTTAPDWVCEVLSPSTERHDRLVKMPFYASLGIGHAWLVHPRHRSIEVCAQCEGRWLAVAVHEHAKRARIPPFEALELDVAVLWEDMGPLRAREEPAEYVY